MPTLECPVEHVEPEICVAEESVVVATNIAENDTSMEATILREWRCENISVEQYRGQLRLRFCIPGNYEMQVLRQGIVVPIPDHGHHQNIAQWGVCFCWGEYGGIEATYVRRDAATQEWAAYQQTILLRSEQDIPSYLKQTTQKVNWDASEAPRNLRIVSD